MKKFPCNPIATPRKEQIEMDSLVDRILAAGDSVQSRSTYASNVQVLLSRLTAEGFQLPPVKEDREAHR